VRSLLQELAQLPQTPINSGLWLNNPYNASNILAQIPQFSATVRSWKSRTEQLEALIASLDPFAVLSTIKDLLIVRLKALQKQLKVPKGNSQSLKPNWVKLRLNYNKSH